MLMQLCSRVKIVWAGERCCEIILGNFSPVVKVCKVFMFLNYLRLWVYDVLSQWYVLEGF
jgi:hypothetical protein